MLEASNIQIPERISLAQFRANAGQLHVILGSNGSGKSSLLGALAGLIELPEAEVKLGGEDLQQLSAESRAARMAVLTQRQSLDFDFEVADVIRMGLHPLQLDESEAQARFSQVVEALDLAGLLTRRYPTLSRGEAQRTQIARVLMQRRAKVGGAILLDEPLTALDLRHQHTVMQYAEQMKAEGHVLVMVLHDLDIAAQFGDSFTLLEHGAVVGSGDQSVLQPELLSRVFEIEIERKVDEEGRLQFRAVTIND